MSLREVEKWVFVRVYVFAGRRKCDGRADVKLLGERHSSLSNSNSITATRISNDSYSPICYMCVLKGALTIQYGMKNSGFEAACAGVGVCLRVYERWDVLTCECTSEHTYTHSPETLVCKIQWQSKMRQQFQSWITIMKWLREKSKPENETNTQ